MDTLITAAIVAISATWALWVFYLAVMALKRAKDENKLSRTALVLGTPVLWIGYTLDAFVNVTVMTVVLIELPREVLVTDRLKRHKSSTGWRLKVVLWFEPILDPFDPSGDHV